MTHCWRAPQAPGQRYEDRLAEVFTEFDLDRCAPKAWPSSATR